MGAVRYTTLSASAGWWDAHRGTDALARTVHEDDVAPVKTGLVDAAGRDLFRVVERIPIGFVHPKD